LQILFKNEKSGLINISQLNYYEKFINGRTKQEIKDSYEKVWAAKNFDAFGAWLR